MVFAPTRWCKGSENMRIANKNEKKHFFCVVDAQGAPVCAPCIRRINPAVIQISLYERIVRRTICDYPQVVAERSRSINLWYFGQTCCFGQTHRYAPTKKYCTKNLKVRNIPFFSITFAENFRALKNYYGIKFVLYTNQQLKF